MENPENNGGNFLQSEEWRKFQEAVGRRTFRFDSEGVFASVIEHALPLVGRYWYVPRGPVIARGKEQRAKDKGKLRDLLESAKKNGAGWIRMEPETEESLDALRKSVDVSVTKAPHDMQPRETLVIDISMDEEMLLARMKPKVRYNVRLAARKGVKVFATHDGKYREAFGDLIRITAERDGITAHPRAYYETMFRSLPEALWELFVAELDGKVLAANMVVFWRDTAIYLHGASGNDRRDVMAPYALQWEAIREARRRGCVRYDLGGVKVSDGAEGADWSGITRFKQGFSPDTGPTRFPGAYDIVLSGWRHATYRCLTAVKRHVILPVHRLFGQASGHRS